MRIKFQAWFVFFMILSFSVSSSAGQREEGFDAYKSGDFKRAYELWLPYAKAGDMDMQYMIGSLYDYGEGVSMNHEEAVKWYTLAAEQDNPYAQFNLGTKYLSGEGVPQNYETAYVMWCEASVSGVVSAEKNLNDLINLLGWGEEMKCPSRNINNPCGPGKALVSVKDVEGKLIEKYCIPTRLNH